MCRCTEYGTACIPCLELSVEKKTSKAPELSEDGRCGTGVGASLTDGLQGLGGKTMETAIIKNRPIRALAGAGLAAVLALGMMGGTAGTAQAASYKAGGGSAKAVYQVKSKHSKTTVYKKCLAKSKTATIPSKAKVKGKYRKVVQVKANAFQSAKHVKYVTVKTRHLGSSSKYAFKHSNVKKVVVRIGSAKSNKGYAKKLSRYIRDIPFYAKGSSAVYRNGAKVLKAKAPDAGTQRTVSEPAADNGTESGTENTAQAHEHQWKHVTEHHDAVFEYEDAPGLALFSHIGPDASKIRMLSYNDDSMYTFKYGKVSTDDHFPGAVNVSDITVEVQQVVEKTPAYDEEYDVCTSCGKKENDVKTYDEHSWTEKTEHHAEQIETGKVPVWEVYYGTNVVGEYYNEPNAQSHADSLEDINTKNLEIKVVKTEKVKTYTVCPAYDETYWVDEEDGVEKHVIGNPGYEQTYIVKAGTWNNVDMNYDSSTGRCDQLDQNLA